MFLSSLLVVMVMVVTVHTVSEYFIHNQDGVIMARAGQKVGRQYVFFIQAIMNCLIISYATYRKRLKLCYNGFYYVCHVHVAHVL